MNKKAVGTIVLTLFCIASVLWSATPAAFASPDTYTLTVTVVDAVTSNPLAGANVSSTGPENSTGTTGSNGKITFNNTQTGNYTVYAEMTGYSPSQPQNVSLTTNTTITIKLTSIPSLAPTIQASNSSGAQQNVFNICDNIYVNGTGYPASSCFNIYVVVDTEWSNGTCIPDRVCKTATKVSSNSNGTILPKAVWNAPLKLGKYDIVVDVNRNGKYDLGIDALWDDKVEVKTPKIVLSPSTGPVGTPITVNGTGFSSGAIVDLWWFGYIVDIPYVKGHLGYYPIKSNISVSLDGNFLSTFAAPYDFGPGITHYVKAIKKCTEKCTYNEECTHNEKCTYHDDCTSDGKCEAYASFTIRPSLQLSPQPANFEQSQNVTLYIYGAPIGEKVCMDGQPSNLKVLRLTYDNSEWGYATSYLRTQGTTMTGGLAGGDIGGNATIRFTAVGWVGEHVIRAYLGEKDAAPNLQTEIGGQVEFYILGSGSDTQAVLDKLDALNATVASLQSDISAMKSDVGTIKNNTDTIASVLNSMNATIVSIKGDVATLITSVGTLTTSLSSLDAKIVSLQGDTATIKTNVGTITTSLSSIDAKIVSLQNDTATIKTSLGIIDGKVTSILNNTATIQTSLGEVSLTMGDVQASEMSAGTSLSSLVIAAVIIIIIAAVLTTVLRRFRKTKRTE
jgi:hypothetical protein